jgi:hypothetical protein
MEGSPGPEEVRYGVPLDRPFLYRWAPLNGSTVNHVTVLGSTGGLTGCWIQVRFDDRGDDLGDADATLGVADGSWFVLPASTLTNDRSLILSTEGAAAGDTIEVTRHDVEAFAYTILNGVGEPSTLVEFPASTKAHAVLQFDGTNWLHRSSSTLL